MLTISAIILSLSILMGAPSQAPMPAPVDAVQVQCEEDMDCWDADTMGNGQHDTIEAEAWDTIDASGIGNDTSKTLMLSYTSSQSGAPASLPLGQFSVESNTTPNLFHIFQWDTLYFA